MEDYQAPQYIFPIMYLKGISHEPALKYSSK